MLVSLAIHDVVLIERMSLAVADGLSVFTGETGAGKSILLDSLGLALGARADTGLIRHGAAQASVTAAFELAAGHPALALAEEQGVGGEGSELILRRVIGADGRSRAFVNDQTVSVGLLRRIGTHLAEIHGQFESHGLLDPGTHRGVLDSAGDLGEQAASVRAAWSAWRDAASARAKAEADRDRARAEEDSLRAQADELAALAPQPGEEETLAQARTTMMHGEKLVEAMNAAMEALTRPGAAESALSEAERSLNRVAEYGGDRLEPVLRALERATIEVAEATGLLERASADIDLDPQALERAEERLFALRAAARKYQTDCDGLAALAAEMAERLAALDGGDEGLVRLARAEMAARAAYVEAAQILSKGRARAAHALDEAVAAELPPLKLERASFHTRLTPLDEADWGEHGIETVEFLTATNPGAPPGPLARIASGGELARFMLALKVILARTSPVATLIFDEVDTGIGGAVAAAVGDRLARLSDGLQVLVVTHSPQVAARGHHHFRVAKGSGPAGTTTSIEALSAELRREEVARMLAGERVTDEARAAADSLLARP